MTYNNSGKNKIECSCGTEAWLSDYEVQDWSLRHAATNPSIKHTITKTEEVAP